MTPDGIKDRFELYRKWFKTLLIKEFLNLPSKYQDRFIAMVERFLEDCKKICGEGKSIKERIIQLTITEIIPVLNKEELFKVYCKSNELENKVLLSIYKSSPKPKLGDKMYHTVFSVNGEVWYSSKEELIKKGC